MDHNTLQFINDILQNVAIIFLAIAYNQKSK